MTDRREPRSRTGQRRGRRILDGLLNRISERRRVVFALFEIEGYTGEEIASLLGIPLATVWTRLRHAPKDLVVLVAERNRREKE